MTKLRDLLRPILRSAERIAEFQRALNAMGTPAEQKNAIMMAHCHGLLSEQDTQLLFDVYDLAEA